MRLPPQTLPVPRGGVWILLAIGLVLLAARVGFVLKSDVFPDEALYAWLWHVAPLNFCPHPPGTPALAGLGIALLGKTELGLRLAALVVGCLIPAVVYLLGRCVAGLAVAWWAALFSLATPMHCAFGTILTPDGTQLVFWGVALTCAWRALESRALGWWVATGLIVGVGLYVKYMMILIFPALVLCLCVVPQWREQWRTAGPWCCALVAGIFFAPVAGWVEMQQGWPTIQYHLVSRQTGQTPSLRDIAIYQLVHWGYYSALLYPALVLSLMIAVRRGIRNRDRTLVFLGFTGGFTWIFFAVIASMTKRELSREQWDATAYIPGMVALAVLAERWLAAAQDSRTTRRWRLVVALPAVGFLTMAVVFAETFTGAISKVSGERQLFSNTEGWQEMVERADEELAKLPRDVPRFYLSNDFSGALVYWFYGKDTTRVYTLDHASNRQYGLEQLLFRHGISEEHVTGEYGHNGIVAFKSRSGRTTPARRLESVRKLFTNAYLPEWGGVVGKYTLVVGADFGGRKSGSIIDVERALDP